MTQFTIFKKPLQNTGLEGDVKIVKSREQNKKLAFQPTPIKKYIATKMEVKNFSLACFYSSNKFYSCYSVMSLLSYRLLCS